MEPFIHYFTEAYWLEPTVLPLSYEAHCFKDRIAYDIGSDATKTMAATVNVCKMSVEHVFSEDFYPILYRQDLSQSSAHEFSDLIKELGLKTLLQAKEKLQPMGEFEHCAIATAAFRAANNGESFAQDLSEKLQIPVQIISQEEEGKLAYYSAIAQLGGGESSAPIVWDIGGGSMQLTFKSEGDQFYIMGGELAAATFQTLVFDTIGPYPLNAEQVQAAIDLAKKHLVFDNISTEVIQAQINKGDPVVAVGSVHNFAVKPLCQLTTGKNVDSFTKNDLQQAIVLLTNKTESEISNLMQYSPDEFVNNQLTNLILVYAMMDKMGIEQVRTVQTSNVQGLLLKGC